VYETLTSLAIESDVDVTTKQSTPEMIYLQRLVLQGRSVTGILLIGIICDIIKL